MHLEKIRELMLMEELAKHEGVATQRELAGKLNISLGLVNLFVRRVVRKGYFKVTTIPGRRVRYILTPKGLAEKSRLAVSYLNYSMKYYRDIRDQLGRSVASLKKMGVGRVALVGTGELAELFCLFLREGGIEVAAVVDLNEGGNFLRHSVHEIAFLGGREDLFDKICIMDLQNVDRIFQELERNKISADRVLVGPLGAYAARGAGGAEDERSSGGELGGRIENQQIG